jgi:glucose-1-phosphatase
MGREIGLVCFDLGGVIIRHYRSWSQACAGLGVAYESRIDTPELITQRRALTHEFQCGRVEEGEFFERLHALTLGAYGAEVLRRLHANWIYGEYEGVDRVLERLVRAGRAATAVLSNTNRVHWARMSGPTADFRTPSILANHHASHLMGLCKPDPRIYEALEGAVGYRGAQVLFFDDLPENVAAAAARGWRTCLIDHTAETAPQIERALAERGLIEPGG